MSHQAQLDFVAGLKQRLPEYFRKGRVLEVGSLDINGSVRQFFEDCDYTGVDLGEGKGVDLVARGEELDYFDGNFTVCLSCECFEHNPFWKETFLNMICLCKSGGLVVFTCATTGRPEHGTERSTPQDSPLTIAKGWSYYLNLTEEDFQSIFNFDALFTDWQFSVNEQACDLYFYGVKR